MRNLLVLTNDEVGVSCFVMGPSHAHQELSAADSDRDQLPWSGGMRRDFSTMRDFR